MDTAKEGGPTASLDVPWIAPGVKAVARRHQALLQRIPLNKTWTTLSICGLEVQQLGSSYTKLHSKSCKKRNHNSQICERRFTPINLPGHVFGAPRGIYLDDILIFNRTRGEHVKHIGIVLELLHQQQLYAKM